MSAHNPDDLDAADPPADDPDAGTMAAARGRIYGLLAATFDGDVDQVATALAKTPSLTLRRYSRWISTRSR